MGLLEQVAVQTATIKIGTKKGKVRGLSLEDIGILMKDHAAEISKLFEGQVNIQEIATTWPVVTAKMIAIAMDEPDDWEHAKKLALTTQLDALMKIWDLTVVDEEVLGKIQGRLVIWLNQRAAQVSDESKSQTGSET